MDGLNDKERIEAWKSAWHPSFAGKAIINSDFTFRSVNPQFCKLLGVTPADLLEQRFQDITHPDVRKLDEANAELVKKGKIDFYLLQKKFLFSDNHEVEAILLVTRTPTAPGVFQFFLARIMLDESKELINLTSGSSSQTWTSQVMDFLQCHGKMLVAIGTVAGAAIIAIAKALGLKVII